MDVLIVMACCKFYVIFINICLLCQTATVLSTGILINFISLDYHKKREVYGAFVCICIFVCSTLPQHGLMSSVYVHTQDPNQQTPGHQSRAHKLNYSVTGLAPPQIFSWQESTSVLATRWWELNHLLPILYIKWMEEFWSQMPQDLFISQQDLWPCNFTSQHWAASVLQKPLLHWEG